jgi:hypothetical protein
MLILRKTCKHFMTSQSVRWMGKFMMWTYVSTSSWSDILIIENVILWNLNRGPHYKFRFRLFYFLQLRKNQQGGDPFNDFPLHYFFIFDLLKNHQLNNNILALSALLYFISILFHINIISLIYLNEFNECTLVIFLY